MQGVPFGGDPDHVSRHQEINEVMNKGEAKSDKEARTRIVDIDFHPDRRCHVTNYRFRDAKDAEWLPGQAVLNETDNAASDGAGNGIAPRDGKKDGHDQRNIK